MPASTVKMDISPELVCRKWPLEISTPPPVALTGLKGVWMSASAVVEPAHNLRSPPSPQFPVPTPIEMFPRPPAARFGFRGFGARWALPLRIQILPKFLPNASPVLRVVLPVMGASAEVMTGTLHGRSRG